MKILFEYDGEDWNLIDHTPLLSLSFALGSKTIKPLAEIMQPIGLTPAQQVHAQLGFTDPDERADYMGDCIAGERPPTPEPAVGTLIMIKLYPHSKVITVDNGKGLSFPR
jgi:hypothetical protein